VVRNMGLIAALSAVVATSGAQAQLHGALRAKFVARMSDRCIADAASNEMLSGVSHRVLSSICTCAGYRVANTLDVDSMRQAMAIGQMASFAADAGQEAVEYCLQRRGGFVSGMTVTPNHCDSAV